MHLNEGGAKILGTSPEMIDNAEDRWVHANIYSTTIIEFHRIISFPGPLQHY